MNQLTRLRSRHGLIIALALLLVLIAVPVAVAVAGSGGQDTPPQPPGSNVPIAPTTDSAAPDAENDKAPAVTTDPGYWTEKRMGEATAAPMPTDP